jgi:hypothetical protein
MMGIKRQNNLLNPLFHAEHHSSWRNKTLKLSEAKPSFSTSRQLREVKGSPKSREIGYPFLASSFG